ncbi:hypothetical protein GGH95_006200, partial [Coemansia sp. RSA 1836]
MTTTDTPSAASSAAASGELAKESKNVVSMDLERGRDAKPSTEEPLIKGKQMLGVMVALALSIFLAALDNTIVSTMLPSIARDFDALSQITWIVSSYVVSSTALQPVYGKLCHVYGH